MIQLYFQTKMIGTPKIEVICGQKCHFQPKKKRGKTVILSVLLKCYLRLLIACNQFETGPIQF